MPYRCFEASTARLCCCCCTARCGRDRRPRVALEHAAAIADAGGLAEARGSLQSAGKQQSSHIPAATPIIDSFMFQVPLSEMLMTA